MTKRFFACGECGARRATLGCARPVDVCACGASDWQRCGANGAGGTARAERAANASGFVVAMAEWSRREDYVALSKTANS